MTSGDMNRTSVQVGFQPSICPRCGHIQLETDIGATLCPYHADSITMNQVKI